MRVLRVINSLNIGGAERSIVENVPIHIKNGIDMDVLLLNGRNTFFLDLLKKEKVNIYSLGETVNIYNPFLIFRLIKFFKNYDIVHVHLFPALYWVAFARILSFSKINLVFTEHATNNRRRSVPILKFFDKLIYAQYKVIIAISQGTKDNLVEHLKLKSDKIKVINNGVNFNRLKAEGEINNFSVDYDFDSKKILLQIASFREAKDQDTLIRALTNLPEEYDAVFIGDGFRLEYCRELARKLGVEKRVHFLGMRDSIGAYIAKSDYVIVSSNWEGFGRAAVEGMGMGKIVFASNVTGLREVINNDDLLFEVGNDVELAHKILNINKENFDLLTKHCLDQSKKFSIDNMILQYEDVYKSL